MSVCGDSPLITADFSVSKQVHQFIIVVGVGSFRGLKGEDIV